MPLLLRSGTLASLWTGLFSYCSGAKALGKPEWGSKSTQTAMVSHCTTAFGPVRSHPHRARQSPEADFRLDTSGHQGQAGYKPGPVKVPPSNRGTGLTLSSVSVAPLWYPTPHLRSLCNTSAAPPVTAAGRLAPLLSPVKVSRLHPMRLLQTNAYTGIVLLLFCRHVYLCCCFAETLNTNRTKPLFSVCHGFKQLLFGFRTKLLESQFVLAHFFGKTCATET